MQNINFFMKQIDAKLLQKVSESAKVSPRLRTNYNFHTTAADTLQRMLNAVEPFSYVCPHKHEYPDKREAFIILTGKMLVVEFDLLGNITNHIVLDASAGNFGVELPPATYHTIVALESNTVVYEVKDGPYEVSNDKGFAPWAPEEGSANCQEYLMELLEKLGITGFELPA